MGPWGRRVGTWWGRGDVPILVRLGPEGTCQSKLPLIADGWDQQRVCLGDGLGFPVFGHAAVDVKRAKRG